MRELWVKKTVFRRYIICDDDIDSALQIINNDNGVDFIENYLDQNNTVEYDNEEVFLPLHFEVEVIKT